MYTQPIEAGGDAIKKWVYVVNFWEKDTNTLENHHTMRWAVNLPGVALVTAMGSKPTVYYLLPLSAFSVGVVLLCSIARRRLSVTAMAALVIFLFLEPMMHRASTQFQPIAFGFAYLAASLWFLLAWEQQKQTRHLVVSAVFLFLAYGAKVPYAYFLPGILFFVFASGGLRPAIIWTVAFAFFFNVEALAFNTISDRDLPLGRLSAILSTHNPETGFNHSRYIEYFLMWTKVSWFNQIISILSLGPAILYVLNRKSKSLSPELLLQCLCLTSYHILNTFLVVNFETLMTPQPPEQKYLAVTMPFACLASVLWFHQLSETYRTPLVLNQAKLDFHFI